jgi:DICT domain-containing protein/GGDEF domain-containing protein
MNASELTGAGPVTKRTLVSLSHALEAAALATEGDGPLVVVALFQRLPYFERERAAYSRLAERADEVVVGFVDDYRPLLPGRIHPILLETGEPLTREWTVIVATPTMGGFLVAVDQETAVDGERTLESGRLFTGRWGFSTEGAHAELNRLRDQVATRVPPGVLAMIDQVTAASDAPGRHAAAEDRVTASVRLLLAEIERTRRAGVALQSRLDAVTMTADRDLTSSLHTPAFLERWAGTAPISTPGPLPVGLLLVTVPQLSGVGRYGARVERETLTEIAAVVTRRLRPVDRAVRMADNEFLLVVPGITEEAAADLVRDVTADLQKLGNIYPFVPMEAVSAITVTRQRPLPIDDLRSTVRWAAAQQVPIALLPA